MVIIVGTIIVKDDKILMVKEAKKECYGKWAFPAGHLEENEIIFEGAKRETFEETGCKVELKKAFPIFAKRIGDTDFLMMHFLADIVEENPVYETDEILERKWISIDELENMKDEELRSSGIVSTIINSIKTGQLYDLDIIKNI